MLAGFGQVGDAMGWLVTYVEYTGAEPADVHVCFGSGDGGQLWWDCELLARASTCGELMQCSYRIQKRVEPGVHRLAAGAWHRSGNWGLSLRLLKSDEVTPIVAGDWVRAPGVRWLRAGSGA
jgi:hypothetical protein